MTILVFTEVREQKLKKSSCEAVFAAAAIAKQMGGTVVALVAGNGVAHLAAEVGTYGASKVVVVDQPALAKHSNTAYAKVIAEVARQQHAEMVFFSASQMGKDLAPRVAVKLGAGLATDCIAYAVQGDQLTVSRPVYAGKAIAEVRVTTPVKVYTLRPNVFTAVVGPSAAAVEQASVPVDDADLGSVVMNTAVSTGRPDVTEADIVVSGGRGLKAAEHFKLVEQLADVLGAAVGASRAVVDAGWRPHEEQVGQTGKTVAPTLYVACAISGAVQHLAGMSSSKCIVAINKDKDAPIFQVADYGIVGDVFEILPALTTQLKSALGK
jgi:electron transfer flavoprotein alpha subunit